MSRKPRTADERLADRERAALVRQIRSEVIETAAYTGRDHLSAAVMAAMGKVLRHRFVSPGQETAAYLNAPLSIGHGQTISQPYIVALMTDLAELDAAARVLEIGTGSGYQAAVLAEIAAEVYSIERIGPLAREAARKLAELGYGRVRVREGDGYAGWPEHAPYDAILVTAAAAEPPPPLLQQLRVGGRLVIPLGREHRPQQLVVMVRESAGEFSTRPILPVSFVPFIHVGE